MVNPGHLTSQLKQKHQIPTLSEKIRIITSHSFWELCGKKTSLASEPRIHVIQLLEKSVSAVYSWISWCMFPSSFAIPGPQGYNNLHWVYIILVQQPRSPLGRTGCLLGWKGRSWKLSPKSKDTNQHFWSVRHLYKVFFRRSCKNLKSSNDIVRIMTTLWNNFYAWKMSTSNWHTLLMTDIWLFCRKSVVWRVRTTSFENSLNFKKICHLKSDNFLQDWFLPGDIVVLLSQHNFNATVLLKSARLLQSFFFFFMYRRYNAWDPFESTTFLQHLGKFYLKLPSLSWIGPNFSKHQRVPLTFFGTMRLNFLTAVMIPPLVYQKFSEAKVFLNIKTPYNVFWHWEK